MTNIAFELVWQIAINKKNIVYLDETTFYGNTHMNNIRRYGNNRTGPHHYSEQLSRMKKTVQITGIDKDGIVAVQWLKAHKLNGNIYDVFLQEAFKRLR